MTMKLIRLLPLMIVCVLGLALPTACINDDITTSPTAMLRFSRDTLSFDTVFTDVGTPTARLLVYNPNSKGVNISQIKMRDNNSRFSINVDGMSGTEFHDIEIRGKDSIYVFVECFIDPAQNSEPMFVEDKLEFVTNGNVQEVQCQAWGQNVTRMRGVTLEQDMRLTAEQPYVIFDSLVVAPGTTLTIDPGARVLFHDKAELIVQGKLEAVGKQDNMVHLRGDRSDKVLPNLTYAEMSAQWGGIRIAPESFENRMEFVDMRSTDYGLIIDSCGVTDRAKLLIVNSWLHNSAGHVLQSEYAQVNAYGTVFSDAALGVVSLNGGRHEMVQCTFANYYLFAATSGPIVGMYGLKHEETHNPMQAVFANCIIDGLGNPIMPGDLKDTQVFLHYTLFQVDGKNDDNFLDCLWGKDPKFLTDRRKYYFNYHVEPKSPALYAGDPVYVTAICRYDMDGNDRLDGGAPTLGAYAEPQKPKDPQTP